MTGTISIIRVMFDGTMTLNTSDSSTTDATARLYEPHAVAMIGAAITRSRPVFRTAEPITSPPNTSQSAAVVKPANTTSDPTRPSTLAEMKKASAV